MNSCPSLFADASGLNAARAASSLSARRVLLKLLAGAVACALLFASGNVAQAKEKQDLDIELAVHQVTRDASGSEKLTNDIAVDPGAVVQYSAVYRNTTSQSLRNLKPGLPVPHGMELLPGSVTPAPAFASIDGKTFETYPIRRTHRLPDGRMVTTEVPASQYRMLRWDAGDLSAGQSLTVVLRARISDVEALALK